ncbi:prolyl oligopeptidase family serine peptidase [Flavobacterium soli]|uniref:prolyl oligopeptidase family serine peptidase n=1 Tax=Flavobacterium soli TaxID=344881 RepID=UPI0003FC5785|nr:prolyl oligopeptidase family serine peptidase [Flavobacterium soli]
MNRIIFSLIFLLNLQILFGQEFPKAKKTPKTVTKHNISFVDDYSWLEDMRSNEVNNWLDEQNKIVDEHLKGIFEIYNPSTTIKEYDKLTTYRIPERKGKYYYSYYRKESKSSSLYMRNNVDDKSVEIIDPNTIYEDKIVTLSNHYPSGSSKYLAYKIRIDGSDKEEIRFFDLDKREKMEDILYNVKFSNVSWNGDLGVFYKKNNNQQQFAKDSTFQLFYHKIGFKQDDDELVYDGANDESNISFFTAWEKLFVIENDKNDVSKNYYYGNLKDEKMVLEKFIENDSTNFKFLSYKTNRVYYSTRKYNWGEIRSFDLNNPAENSVVVPQIYNHLLQKSLFYKDYIICKYKTIGKNYFIVYDYNGKMIRKVEVQPGLDLEIISFDSWKKDIFYGSFSYVDRYENHKFNIDTGADILFFTKSNPAKPTLFPYNHFETKTISYKNRDNIDIPITIVYKKGIVLDGNNPTLLKAYGGFGKVNIPSYDTGLIYFLENGGVFAYAEIRGGGEKGVKWHTDGMGLKKMNSFNDFIDAAEFLIKEKYTTPNKLAITGASQGGLLVGVAMTQRPELFKVAIPDVGVFDMANFHQYSIGRFHYDEYGNPEKTEDFKAMMDYSPYHNIKDDVNYPITLIITSENDDRVPPVHSYKFAAKLQNRTAQKNPVFIKTLKKAGHYGNNSSYENRIQEKSELYAFLLYHLNQ